MLPSYSAKYAGNDNHQFPKSDYVEKIHNMNDEDLLSETSQKIWLSAYANNNPRSDYHWHVDVCYDEWVLRDKRDMYSKAFDRARGDL